MPFSTSETLPALRAECGGVTKNDSVDGVFRTINIARTHSVSTWDNGNFKKSSPDRIVYPTGLQFCRGIEGDKTHNFAVGEF